MNVHNLVVDHYLKPNTIVITLGLRDAQKKGIQWEGMLLGVWECIGRIIGGHEITPLGSWENCVGRLGT